MLDNTCPCCGQTVSTERPLVSLNHIAYRGQTVRVMRRCAELMTILLDAYPDEVTTDRCIARLFGIREPADPNNVVRAYVCHLRKAVRPLGMGITSAYYCGYRLFLPTASEWDRMWKPKFVEHPRDCAVESARQ